MKRSRLVRLIGAVMLATVVVLIFLFSFPNSVFAHNVRLEIIGGAINVKSDNDQNGRLISNVLIQNYGPEIKTLLFATYDAGGNPIKFNVNKGGPGIPGYSVSPFEIEFFNQSNEKIAGQFVVLADHVIPAVESISIDPIAKKFPALFWIDKLGTSQIISFSFFIGFIFVLLFSQVLILRHFKKEEKYPITKGLQCRINGLKWDFKENWASTFVAVGGILATIVGSDIMPESPIIVSKQGFQTLNILFPTLIVLAPFLSIAINAVGNDPRKKDGTFIVDEEGKTPLLIFAFGVGSAVVTWAVIGELLTLAVLFQELLVAQYITASVAQAAQLIMLLIGILGLIYSVKKTVQISFSANPPEELKASADSSGIVKASRDGDRLPRPVYLP